MANVEIVFAPRAQQDLDEIWDYIATELDNRAAAANTVDSILSRIDLLKTFPESGTPLSSIYPIKTDYRFVVCGNYLAFYRYHSRVYIDRILYAKRNYLKILFS